MATGLIERLSSLQRLKCTSTIDLRPVRSVSLIERFFCEKCIPYREVFFYCVLYSECPSLEVFLCVCVCVLLVNEFTVFFEEKFEVSELRCMADHALNIH